MGGVIGVHSKGPMLGSEFWFTLPVRFVPFEQRDGGKRQAGVVDSDAHLMNAARVAYEPSEDYVLGVVASPMPARVRRHALGRMREERALVVIASQGLREVVCAYLQRWGVAHDAGATFDSARDSSIAADQRKMGRRVSIFICDIDHEALSEEVLLRERSRFIFLCSESHSRSLEAQGSASWVSGVRDHALLSKPVKREALYAALCGPVDVSADGDGPLPVPPRQKDDQLRQLDQQEQEPEQVPPEDACNISICSLAGDAAEEAGAQAEDASPVDLMRLQPPPPGLHRSASRLQEEMADQEPSSNQRLLSEAELDAKSYSDMDADCEVETEPAAGESGDRVMDFVTGGRSDGEAEEEDDAEVRRASSEGSAADLRGAASAEADEAVEIDVDLIVQQGLRLRQQMRQSSDESAASAVAVWPRAAHLRHGNSRISTRSNDSTASGGQIETLRSASSGRIDASSTGSPPASSPAASPQPDLVPSMSAGGSTNDSVELSGQQSQASPQPPAPSPGAAPESLGSSAASHGAAAATARFLLSFPLPLPFSRSAAAAPAPSPAPSSTPVFFAEADGGESGRRRPRILIVEDDAVSLLVRRLSFVKGGRCRSTDARALSLSLSHFLSREGRFSCLAHVYIYPFAFRLHTDCDAVCEDRRVRLRRCARRV